MPQLFKVLITVVLFSFSGRCAFGACEGTVTVSGSVTKPESVVCVLSVSTKKDFDSAIEREVSGTIREHFVVDSELEGHWIRLTWGGRRCINLCG